MVSPRIPACCPAATTAAECHCECQQMLTQTALLLLLLVKPRLVSICSVPMHPRGWPRRCYLAVEQRCCVLPGCYQHCMVYAFRASGLLLLISTALIHLTKTQHAFPPLSCHCCCSSLSAAAYANNPTRHCKLLLHSAAVHATVS